MGDPKRSWFRSHSKYLTAGRVSLRSQWVYPGEFLAPTLTYALFVFVFIRLYTTALAPGQEIAGYGQAALVYYFVVAELVLFGFGRMFSLISEEVKTGQVVYSLARPYDFIRYQRSVLLGPAILQTLILALVGLGLAVFSVGPPGPISLLQAAALILSLILSATLSFSLQMILALTAFWFEENSAFFWIYQKLGLVIGTLMPLEFLPPPLVQIAVWTPFPSLAYAPARISVAFEPQEALGLLGVQTLWVILAGLCCRWLFTLGRRKVALNGG